MGEHTTGRRPIKERARPILHAGITLMVCAAVACTSTRFVDPPRVIGDPLAEAGGIIGDDDKHLSWSVAIADGEGGRWCVDAQLVEGEARRREPGEARGPCNQLFPPDPGADRIAVSQGTTSTADYTLAWGSVKRGTPVCAITHEGHHIPAERLLGPWPFRVWVVAAKKPARFITEDCAADF